MSIGTLAVIAAAGVAVGEPTAAKVVVAETSTSTAYEAGRWASNIVAVLGLVWMFRMTVIGIRRRRSEWSRQNWIRFIRQIGLVGMVIFASLIMAGAVDRGVYDVLPRKYHGLYLTVMMILGFGGAVTFSHLLERFAKGP